MQMENYDAAAEDFKQALLHAGCQLSEADRGALREDLRAAESKANIKRNKPKNYYMILGMF